MADAILKAKALGGLKYVETGSPPNENYEAEVDPTVATAITSLQDADIFLVGDSSDTLNLKKVTRLNLGLALTAHTHAATDITAGTLGAGTYGLTGQLNVDNLRLDGNILSSTSGLLQLKPTTNLEFDDQAGNNWLSAVGDIGTPNFVLTIGDIDGANSGDTIIYTEDTASFIFGPNIAVRVGNLQLAAQTLSSFNTNGDIILNPNGVGDIELMADVGCNKANPVVACDVGGGLQCTGTDTLSINAIGLRYTTSIGYLETTNNRDMRLRVGGADILTLDSSAGGVAINGIAVTGTNKLDVTGNTLLQGKLEIQNNANEELLILDQNDVDAPFIDFQGTTAADHTKSLSTLGSAGSHTTGDDICGPIIGSPGWLHEGMIRVEINGSKKWLAYYRDTT